MGSNHHKSALRLAAYVIQMNRMKEPCGGDVFSTPARGEYVSTVHSFHLALIRAHSKIQSIAIDNAVVVMHGDNLAMSSDETKPGLGRQEKEKAEKTLWVVSLVPTVHQQQGAGERVSHTVLRWKKNTGGRMNLAGKWYFFHPMIRLRASWAGRNDADRKNFGARSKRFLVSPN